MIAVIETLGVEPLEFAPPQSIKYLITTAYVPHHHHVFKINLLQIVMLFAMQLYEKKRGRVERKEKRKYCQCRRE